MPWHARLDLDYHLQAGRCVARHAHEGPLRVLQSLYPEGGAVCHNVLVHPPSGLVGGDTLAVSLRAAAATHAVLTTPGATRFYRSDGEPAAQRVRLRLDAGARVEWLPLEAIFHSGCRAENRLEVELAPGAELIGWDIAALGLPASGQPFASGSVLQHIELAGQWLERGRIDAADTRLLDGPLGLAGRRCMATVVLATGTPLARERRAAALEAAERVICAHGLQDCAAATAPAAGVVVLRALTPLVEPAMLLARAVRNAWREALWDLPPNPPRTWQL